MEMHQARYFLAAAKALSFTRAAQDCHVSQPALTTAIKKLEAEFGSPLFLREGHQVALTEFGRRMQPHLSQVVEQAKAAETVAKDFRLLNAQRTGRYGYRRATALLNESGRCPRNRTSFEYRLNCRASSAVTFPPRPLAANR